MLFYFWTSLSLDMQTHLITVLQRHFTEFHPVVPVGPGIRFIRFDFTRHNNWLPADVLTNTAVFSELVDHQLGSEKATYGIGGYAEHRTLYDRSAVFNADRPGDEPRRLHLGTDIWGAAGTPVFAPCDGIVHSFADNDRFGDYGATIILSHMIEGKGFYTLYGHLTRASLKGLTTGKKIAKGEPFSAFGIADENGHWPPHLHFQLIDDMLDYHGDYPGVCRFSEKEYWLNLCPDPEWILQLERYL